MSLLADLLPCGLDLAAVWVPLGLSLVFLVVLLVVVGGEGCWLCGTWDGVWIGESEMTITPVTGGWYPRMSADVSGRQRMPADACGCLRTLALHNRHVELSVAWGMLEALGCLWGMLEALATAYLRMAVLRACSARTR